MNAGLQTQTDVSSTANAAATVTTAAAAGGPTQSPGHDTGDSKKLSGVNLSTMSSLSGQHQVTNLPGSLHGMRPTIHVAGTGVSFGVGGPINSTSNGSSEVQSEQSAFDLAQSAAARVTGSAAAAIAAAKFKMLRSNTLAAAFFRASEDGSNQGTANNSQQASLIARPASTVAATSLSSPSPSHQQANFELIATRTKNDKVVTTAAATATTSTITNAAFSLQSQISR